MAQPISTPSATVTARTVVAAMAGFTRAIHVSARQSAGARARITSLQTMGSILLETLSVCAA